MKILLTGPNAFSGKVILKFFINKGYDITIISRTRSYITLPSNVTLIHSDLSNIEYLNDKFDAVVHIAATSPTLGVSDSDLIQDNVLATRNLIHLVKNCDIKKFIFFSSCSVYGEINQPVLTERTPIYNPCLYGASKLVCETMLGAQKSFSSLAIRLPAIVGQGSARHWLANTVNKALAGEKINIYNHDSNFNNAIHINDLAKFVDHLLHIQLSQYFDYINIASSGGLPIKCIVEEIITKLNSNSKINLNPAEKPSFTISNAYAVDKYAFEPATFTETLNSYLGELSRQLKMEYTGA